MKVRFVIVGQGIMEGRETLIGEFDVEKRPTKAQTQAIYSDINGIIEKYYEREIEITDATYKRICQNACEKHLTLVKNPIVKTFYL